MKTKLKNKNDVAGMMVQIQEQLAVMNEKLDSFMTKSLTELAQAMAAAKPVVRTAPTAPQTQGPVRPTQHKFLNQRQMYAVVCYECGKDAELPFKPSGDRPVFCPECFAARRGRTPPAAPVVPGKLSSPSMSSPSLQSSAPAAPVVKGTKKVASAKTAKTKRAPVKKTAAKKKPAVKKKQTVKKRK